MNFPPDVNDLLDALLSGIRQALKDNLVGIYLRGSLAMGDFQPATSDIDVLAVTERLGNNAEFAALQKMHAGLTALPNPYANRLEIAYIDRPALRRFEPGLKYPTLGQGEVITWAEHRDNWILERWTVREHGVALLGPDARSLIDPIVPGEIRAAVRNRLGDWAAWASQPDDPDWSLPRAHKAYVVETMCRALYTLSHGELASKSQAVAWAIDNLPEPWRTTAEHSLVWHGDRTLDPSLTPEVMSFVNWAALIGESESPVTRP